MTYKAPPPLSLTYIPETPRSRYVGVYWALAGISGWALALMFGFICLWLLKHL